MIALNGTTFSITLSSMNPLHSLLSQSIDYAGLFPPAGLSMIAAAENYREYQGGSNAWALGRFIVPAGRLAELGEATSGSSAYQSGPWRLSVLVGPDLADDLNQIAKFERTRESTSGRMTVDAVEVKADSVAIIQETRRQIPDRLQAFFEVSSDRDPTDLLETISRAGAHAKVRTGGVTPQAFPSTTSLARFIQASVRAKVAYKATAGLHHALRAEYPLTYEMGSSKGVMFGFLNVLLATALALEGKGESDTCAILEESSPKAFRLEDRAISWRNDRLTLDGLQRSRESLVSFGSCSFTEPIAELQALGWLQPEMHRA